MRLGKKKKQTLIDLNGCDDERDAILVGSRTARAVLPFNHKFVSDAVSFFVVFFFCACLHDNKLVDARITQK